VLAIEAGMLEARSLSNASSLNPSRQRLTTSALTFSLPRYHRAESAMPGLFRTPPRDEGAAIQVMDVDMRRIAAVLSA